jgi:predicted transcriptional regulator
MTPTDQKTDPVEQVFAEQAPLYEMMGNPLRTRIIMALADREGSPKELADSLGQKFQTVCTQIRWLERRGFIELVEEDKKKGGVQHFYKTTVHSRVEADEWEHLPEFARRSSSAAILQVVVQNLRKALASGDFDAHRHRVLLLKPMLVDEQGMRELDESALRNLDEQERIEAESAARRIVSGQRAIPVKAVTIVHPAAGSGLKPAG